MAQCYIFITLLVHTFVFKVICSTVSLEMILNNEILRFPRAFSNRKGWQVWEEITLLTSATADRQSILFVSKLYNLLMKSPKTIWRGAYVPKADPSCCSTVQKNLHISSFLIWFRSKQRESESVFTGWSKEQILHSKEGKEGSHCLC